MKHEQDAEPTSAAVSRRKFFGHLSKAGAAAVAIGALGTEPLLGSPAPPAAGDGMSDVATRANEAYKYRMRMAQAEKVNMGVQAGNGDETRFTDLSGNFSKALLHDALGIPNTAACLSLKRAMTTGRKADFDNIVIGTPGGGGNSKLNGPQVALAFDLQGIDSHATVIPPAPSVASAQTAAEAVEHYWGALLRDVPFADYPANPLVAQAVADMNRLSFFASSANKQAPYPITPQNIFRGQFTRGDGNVLGPYISQFMAQPTFFGAQPLSRKYRTYLSAADGGSDYLTDVDEYQMIQNGGDSGKRAEFDPELRFVRSGRDLAAYTHVDVLFQEYFVAFLVLSGLGASPNPGNPYLNARAEKAFATLGEPDCAATLAEMATRALKASWYHKWVKDLRMRPEEYCALVHARKTNQNPMPQAAAALHPDVLNSAVLPIIKARYGSYLLPQAFPEGSPTHPCYPTGHGAVGGACITALKFFFNGRQKLRPLLQAANRDLVEASSDGRSLNNYTGADADDIDINGELNKLAYNVSFGHGIHSSIHFRSSTYWSILLGEQVALSVLRDRAESYNEPFTISITKFDGTTATISNQ